MLFIFELNGSLEIIDATRIKVRGNIGSGPGEFRNP